MYKVNLDLHLKYVPPMSEYGPGIVVTRVLELPFPVSNGIRIHSRLIDECPDPMGFTLEDVVWDMDREVFLASTSIEYDFPITWIPGELRRWLSRGWKLGSYRDEYPDPLDDDESAEDSTTTEIFDEDFDDDLPSLPPNRRPREFNLLIKALVRYMVDSLADDETTYAMDKSGRCFTEQEIKDRWNDKATCRWRELKMEYNKLSVEERTAWYRRVEAYPTIDQVVTRTDFPK
ncbi:MAG TPA: hypothetical protein PK093_22775 [Phycisphaerae bacterium]|nr:hypothetical protein [Phycisphaerae bacterium]